MVRTIETGDTNINQRETGQDTIFSGFLCASTNRWNILFRDNTALDRVDILKPAAGFQGLKP